MLGFITRVAYLLCNIGFRSLLATPANSHPSSFRTPTTLSHSPLFSHGVRGRDLDPAFSVSSSLDPDRLKHVGARMSMQYPSFSPLHGRESVLTKPLLPAHRRAVRLSRTDMTNTTKDQPQPLRRQSSARHIKTKKCHEPNATLLSQRMTQREGIGRRRTRRSLSTPRHSLSHQRRY